MRKVIVALLTQIAVVSCALALGAHVIAQLMHSQEPGRVIGMTMATPVMRDSFAGAITQTLKQAAPHVDGPTLEMAVHDGLADSKTALNLVAAVQATGGSQVPASFLQEMVAPGLERRSPAAAQAIAAAPVQPLKFQHNMQAKMNAYGPLADRATWALIALALVSFGVAVSMSHQPTAVLWQMGWGLIWESLGTMVFFFVVPWVLEYAGAQFFLSTMMRIMVGPSAGPLLVPAFVAAFVGVGLLLARVRVIGHQRPSVGAAPMRPAVRL